MALMTLKTFRKLKKRDFENGAVLDEIEAALQQREKMLLLIRELDEEMDGVTYPASAAAILNAFRGILSNNEE